MPNIKSIKAKGRRLQNYIRDQLRTVFVEKWELLPKLNKDDIKSQTMGMTGEDIVLSRAAKKLIPFSFECKNQERLNIWKSLEQAEGNAENRIPILVIKRNGSKVYAVIKFKELLTLMRRMYD